MANCMTNFGNQRTKTDEILCLEFTYIECY